MALSRPISTFCALVVLAWFAPRTFAQNPSTAPASAPGATATKPAEKPADKPTAAAAKPAGEVKPAAAAATTTPTAKKTKKKGAKKPEAPVQPADLAPATEVTKIEPEITYRTAALLPLKRSTYFDAARGDEADQFYATVRFAKVYDYVHEVVVVPMFRTTRNNPKTWDGDYLEQAYIDSQLSQRFTLTAGKKLEAEGSGFFVSPSDLLNENRDVFDPLYQKEGTVFWRMKYRLNDWSVGLGFIPTVGGSQKDGKAWLSAAAEIADTDLRLQMTESASQKTTTGLSAQRFFGPSFELHFDGRYQVKQRFQGGQREAPEQYSSYSGKDPNTTADDTPSGYYLTGTRYVITSKRTIVGEYIQNQGGLLPSEMAVYFADTREAKKIKDPPARLIGRHYGVITYQDDDTAKQVHLAFFVLQNTDDKSTFMGTSAKYTISNLTSVELAPSFYNGKVDSEFGEMPYTQVIYLVFKGRF